MTEFLNFVEEGDSYELVDKIIQASRVASKGAYTSIGDYESKELFQLVKALSAEIKEPEYKIFKEYGEYLFKKFVIKYPQFIDKKNNTFEFLCEVSDHIHREVKKYYRHAKPPRLVCRVKSSNQLILNYSSSRPLTDLAEGLINGCIAFHKEDIEVKREDFPVSEGSKARFLLTKRASE